MNGLIDDFFRDFEPKLYHRGLTFRLILDLLEQNKKDKITIIETGTARLKNNWASDGQSTLIWNWYSVHSERKVEVHSVDISEKAIHTAQSQTANVHYHMGDAVQVLHQFATCVGKTADLLYLDTGDVDINNTHPVAINRMMELMAIWARLPSGCLIVTDDCISNEIGGHILIERFMERLGIAPAFQGFQTAWIKP